MRGGLSSLLNKAKEFYLRRKSSWYGIILKIKSEHRGGLLKKTSLFRGWKDVAEKP